jgi:hypothetical protein
MIDRRLDTIISGSCHGPLITNHGTVARNAKAGGSRYEFLVRLPFRLSPAPELPSEI